LTKLQRNRDILKGFPVLILLILGISFLKSTADDNNSPNAVPVDGNVFVQVEGDVKYPGVYSFDHEPDINEVMEKGRGYASSAAEDNRSNPLHSGTKVMVREDKGSYGYSFGEISSFNKITLGLPVSINAESEEGLAAIPGIGQSLAGEVVRERKRHGGFKSLEELKSVSGIGDKKYKTISAHVTL
jgi:competence protein ComEA